MDHREAVLRHATAPVSDIKLFSEQVIQMLTHSSCDVQIKEHEETICSATAVAR